MNSVSKKHSPLKSSSSSSSTSKNDSHKSKNDSHKSKNESHKSKNIKSNITFSTNSINSSSTPLTPIPDQNTTYYPRSISGDSKRSRKLSCSKIKRRRNANSN